MAGTGQGPRSDRLRRPAGGPKSARRLRRGGRSLEAVAFGGGMLANCRFDAASYELAATCGLCRLDGFADMARGGAARQRLRQATAAEPRISPVRGEGLCRRGRHPPDLVHDVRFPAGGGTSPLRIACRRAAVSRSSGKLPIRPGKLQTRRHVRVMPPGQTCRNGQRWCGSATAAASNRCGAARFAREGRGALQKRAPSPRSCARRALPSGGRHQPPADRVPPRRGQPLLAGGWSRSMTISGVLASTS
jgi:hypothetical protein